MNRVFIVLLALSMVLCSVCRVFYFEETTDKYLNTTWLSEDKSILLHFDDEDVALATGTMLINGYEQSIIVCFVRGYRMDVYDTELNLKLNDPDYPLGDDETALLFSGEFELASDKLTVEHIIMERNVLPKGTDRLVFIRADDDSSSNPN